MTIRFPDTMTFTGYDAPVRFEGEIFNLEIEGEVPRELNGAWYRCGPDPQYPPHRGDDIYINGDGMASMFRFEDGHVDFRQRYVRTERFKAERAARRSLFGEYRNPYTDDPSVAGLDRGTGNTTAIWHGGRLLMLKEDSRPYELDPTTLETKGVFDWDGRLKTRTVTAHPKIDPETGELLFFGYEATGKVGPEMAFCVAAPDGTLTREEWFDAPFVAMVHDFAITRDHVIFPLFPTIADDARMRAGGPHWMTDLTQDTWVGVMPRTGSVKDMRWFRRPGGQAYHVINAFDDGEKVCLDFALSQINAFPYVPDISGAPYDPMKGASLPTRWTFDMSRNDDTIEERTLIGFPGELPAIDERRTGEPYRYAYMGLVNPMRAMLKSGPVGASFNTVGKTDVTTGEVFSWYGDDYASFQEPQFIATGSGEDEGYVLVVIDRHAENRADVGVFDARRFEDGPVATIRLPIRLRTTFHGTWVPGGELPPVA